MLSSGLQVVFGLGGDEQGHRLDECQVGESLGEVTQVLAGCRVDLFCLEVQQAGERQQPLAEGVRAVRSPITASADTSQNEQMVNVPSSPLSPVSVSSAAGAGRRRVRATFASARMELMRRRAGQVSR
jgi:hypothetical protein